MTENETYAVIRDRLRKCVGCGCIALKDGGEAYWTETGAYLSDVFTKPLEGILEGLNAEATRRAYRKQVLDLLDEMGDAEEDDFQVGMNIGETAEAILTGELRVDYI